MTSVLEDVIEYLTESLHDIFLRTSGGFFPSHLTMKGAMSDSETSSLAIEAETLCQSAIIITSYYLDSFRDSEVFFYYYV